MVKGIERGFQVTLAARIAPADPFIKIFFIQADFNVDFLFLFKCLKIDKL